MLGLMVLPVGMWNITENVREGCFDGFDDGIGCCIFRARLNVVAGKWNQNQDINMCIACW